MQNSMKFRCRWDGKINAEFEGIDHFCENVFDSLDIAWDLYQIATKVWGQVPFPGIEVSLV